MRRYRFAMVLAMSLGLGACASTGAVRQSTRPAAGDDFDAGKVAAVTQWAERRGATVIWLHYPTRRHTGDGN